MTLLSELVAAVSEGQIEVVDLTAPLSSQTPILALPDNFGQGLRPQAISKRCIACALARWRYRRFVSEQVGHRSAR